MICDRLDTLLVAARQLFLVQDGLGFCKVVMVGVMRFQHNVLFNNNRSQLIKNRICHNPSD